MEIDTGRHWVGLSEVYIILGECWLPSVDSVHSVHCNYCIPDTIVRINCEHFRLTPFVCGYNNIFVQHFNRRDQSHDLGRYRLKTKYILFVNRRQKRDSMLINW